MCEIGKAANRTITITLTEWEAHDFIELMKSASSARKKIKKALAALDNKAAPLEPAYFTYPHIAAKDS